MKRNTERMMNGFASGVMIAASIWSLLLPSIEQSRQMGKFSFLPTVHKAKETFNPKTKEKVHVPEKKAVRFKLSSVLKEALNN